MFILTPLSSLAWEISPLVIVPGRQKETSCIRGCQQYMASRSGSSPAQCHPPTIPGPWIATRPTSSPSRYRIVIHCQTNSVSVFSTPSLFNAQSVGNSRRHLEICSFISDYDVDTMLLTKMWLCKSGDDAKCPGYKFFSLFPAPAAKWGGGLAFIIKDSLCNHCQLSFPTHIIWTGSGNSQLQQATYFLLLRVPASTK